MSKGVGVIYARFSSHHQREASIEQQVEACKKFAKDEGIEITAIYADRAISGRTDQRPNFQRMMRSAERREFKYVIAWKSNRIGRNMLQAMQNENRLSELGIRCLYTEEDFDNTAAGRFALRSMMNVNQFYSENMAEDIVRGMRANAMDCKVTYGKLPYGYRADDTLHYQVIEAEAEIVREIFSRIANGDTFAELSRSLNERGIRTRAGERME